MVKFGIYILYYQLYYQLGGGSIIVILRVNAQLLFVTIQYVDFYGVTNEHEL